MDWLQLLLGAISPGLNFLGTGTLVYLFGSNRILTRGQHADAMAVASKFADALLAGTVKDFEAQLAEKDRHHAEITAQAAVAVQDLKDALKLAQQTSLEERARADAATNQLAALSEQVTRVVTTLNPEAVT